MTEFARRLAHAPAFQNFITAVIVFAGILVGIETSPNAVALYGGWLHAFDRAVLVVFIAEIVIKLAAEGPKPWRYFRDPFNVFDFTVVAVTLLPFGGQYVTVLRLLRLLRVLRLVHALPRLQILVSALLKSIPSMAYVGVFLALLFYVYGVAGVFLFGKNDPAQFGTLAVAMLTLFTVVTLEGWAELMYTQMRGCDPSQGAASLCEFPEAHPWSAPLYFVSFVLFGTMIVLNLFIGVIMNSMQEAAVETARAEEAKRQLKGAGPQSIEQELEELHRAAQQLAERVLHVQRRQRVAASPAMESGAT
jgi:voltage-gated sodium channel